MTKAEAERLLKENDKGAVLSQSERAYRTLERLIVTMELKPGSIANERDLVDITQMGRTPVREAIQRLAWEGLLEVRPRAGITVASIYPPDFKKVLDARLGVEQVLARDAARFASISEIERLNRSLALMRQAAEEQDAIRLLDADKLFDSVLAEASCNPYASRLAAPLQTHSRRFWYELHTADSVMSSANAHASLIEAIISRDPHKAADMASSLIDHLRTLIR
ncbi:GntR family transcriptional regulator [Falsochrobactrum ovis]|uniref:GntR family transcriptional regulator n=1 Tax=Falsochrobactrum ovis TaxID=1293442 RepID=A0A364JW44_9HYPH|nr:GntR family transcriptional regulator [Falsochrobactrum ovis]RAK30059.1 GntR family transcriptional regulator [Falsochrobactrum ovis]